MGKHARREKQPAEGTRRQRRQELQRQMSTEAASNDSYMPRPTRLEAKTEAQHDYLVKIDSKKLTFGLGPAGTGKTYVCTTRGAQMLHEKKVERLIVTRPAIEAGRGLGFLPGTIEEKFEPYFAPFKAILLEFFGEGRFNYMMSHGQIEIAPLEYIRGLTFDNAFVILDEAQNTTPGQMKLFLTRIGEHSTVVVNGDTDQKDIQGLSGLEDARSRLDGMKDVGIVEFTEDDVVRSGIVKEILKRYRSS